MTLDELAVLLDAEQARAKDEIAKAETAAALDETERAFLGKRSALSTVNQSIKDLAPEDRPRAGQAVSVYKAAVTELLEARRVALGDGAGEAVDRLDLTLPGRGAGRGHLHLITQVQQELEEVFLGLGYEVAEGPEVETDFYNFEALNMPPAHPARSMWDTLYVKLGRPEEVVLRTHTSPVQIRVMESRQPPVYTVMPGRCYRRDTLDARHSPVFHQIEGLVVDRGITFGDLAGTIDAFTRAYFGPGHTSRLRPSYFPFTEPSAEFEVTCFVCDG
ncbi:MAG TPA: phenylalanine--tRNA ligase subunit alpha, partial [Actinomycetota bacterium]|nr:phenylalanine--tRNA ligase subunit alpha [Actinomycetota bacterium]